MAPSPPDAHPHGLAEDTFVELFAAEADVVTAFHGYARALHQILHGCANPARLRVRGYNEKAQPPTPFDMVVLNRRTRRLSSARKSAPWPRVSAPHALVDRLLSDR